jgi:hypothetical protein
MKTEIRMQFPKSCVSIRRQRTVDKAQNCDSCNNTSMPVWCCSERRLTRPNQADVSKMRKGPSINLPEAQVSTQGGYCTLYNLGRVSPTERIDQQR